MYALLVTSFLTVPLSTGQRCLHGSCHLQVALGLLSDFVHRAATMQSSGTAHARLKPFVSIKQRAAPIRPSQQVGRHHAQRSNAACISARIAILVCLSHPELVACLHLGCHEVLVVLCDTCSSVTGMTLQAARCSARNEPQEQPQMPPQHSRRAALALGAAAVAAGPALVRPQDASAAASAFPPAAAATQPLCRTSAVDSGVPRAVPIADMAEGGGAARAQDRIAVGKSGMIATVSSLGTISSRSCRAQVRSKLRRCSFRDFILFFLRLLAAAILAVLQGHLVSH